MKKLERIGSLILIGMAMTWSANIAQAQCGSHGDILVGRTGAGQLKVVSAEFQVEGLVLVCPVNGILQGYTNANPGFDAEEVVNDPGEDFFELGAGAVIRLEAVSLEPALKIWGPGLATLVDAPGERILLGNENLHTHVTWHVDSDDGGFDPGQTSWTATFKLVDTGSTGYAESSPFTLTFVTELPQAVPATSFWGVTILILLILIISSRLLIGVPKTCPCD